MGLRWRVIKTEFFTLQIFQAEPKSWILKAVRSLTATQVMSQYKRTVESSIKIVQKMEDILLVSLVWTEKDQSRLPFLPRL